MTNITAPRLLDHLVLPVANIDVARDRLGALGFTVAPDGKHPFGTENCNVFFKDGTFLEPLGVAHRETCEAKAIKGNTFVGNDQNYRFRRGIEGFSHLVIKSDNAKADHKAFKAEGMSGGKKVRFTRSFTTPSGEKAKVSFKLAFAADGRSPDSGFFSCEVLNAPKVDRSALQTHANGAVSIREVILSEVNPTDFQYFFQSFLNQREMDVDSFGMSFEAANGRVTVLSPDGMQAFYGMESEQKERGMQFKAVVIGVSSYAAARAHLEKNGIVFTMRGSRILVNPAEGQGTTIMFEEVA
ncbi:MAG: VOC family protein [Rhizobiaceae bacterium]